jgi:hypothetical protein
MKLELDDEEAAVLARELCRIIDDDRYPLSVIRYHPAFGR